MTSNLWALLYTLSIIVLTSCNADTKMSAVLDDHGQIDSFLIPDNPADSADKVEKKKKNSGSEIADDIDDQVATEPVATTGSFLTCSYLPSQQQVGESYQVHCHIEAANELPESVIAADFAIVDAAGGSLSLDKLSENFTTLVWVLQVPANTIFRNNIRAKFTFASGKELSLDSKPTRIPELVIQGEYWVAGQPDHFIFDGVREACIEFVNLTSQEFLDGLTGNQSAYLNRLNDDLCTNQQRFLCRSTLVNPVDKWVVSDFVGPFAQYRDACPDGYRFSMPMTEGEYFEVAELIDQVTNRLEIWVAMHDQNVESQYEIVLGN